MKLTTKLLLLIIIAMGLNSCNHYEDDPWYSLIKNPNASITDSRWKVKQLWIDDVDSTAQIMCDTCHYFEEYFFEHDTKAYYPEEEFNGGALQNGKLIVYGHFNWEIIDNTYFRFSRYNEEARYHPTIYDHGAFSNLSAYYSLKWKILRLAKNELALEVTLNNHKYKQLWERVKQ